MPTTMIWRMEKYRRMKMTSHHNHQQFNQIACPQNQWSNKIHSLVAKSTRHPSTKVMTNSTRVSRVLPVIAIVLIVKKVLQARILLEMLKKLFVLHSMKIEVKMTRVTVGIKAIKLVEFVVEKGRMIRTTRDREIKRFVDFYDDGIRVFKVQAD